MSMRWGNKILISFIVLALLFGGVLGFEKLIALTFALPPSNSNIVGEIRLMTVQRGDTLYQIARSEDIGIQELMAANPGIHPNKLRAGQEIVIPTAFILPDAPRNGIVINLAELRLYYYPPNSGMVMTYPIGIGRQGWETPTSYTFVHSKFEFPNWHPPESIREYMLKKKGIVLPEVVPPGPKNPLGDYMLRLNLPGYLIHGTNNPSSVGKRSSSGCIRMYPEDIEELFFEVPTHTPVHIIHTPYKLGWYYNELYLEAHKPLKNYAIPNLINQKMSLFNRGGAVKIDWDRTSKILKGLQGFPIYIGGSKK